MAKPNPTVVAWMLNEIEADLKAMNLWESKPLDPAVVEGSKSAFGIGTMSFTQWLQFVLLPNARGILDSGREDWPNGSNVAAQAVREFDGWGNTDSLVDHLQKFDACFDEELDAAGFPPWINAAGEASRRDTTTPRLHPAEPDRIELAQLPTPLFDAMHLAARLGIKRILIKRDDLTGFELSGNKIRKLEYLIADARAKGFDTLVTHGGFQSNHCRATAAAGARLGMRVRMFLRSADANPPRDGNLFLDGLFGADVSLHAPDEYNNDRKAMIDRIMAAEIAAGRKPYFFPVGASVPLGCWGYIRCMHELSTQLLSSELIDLFVPVSSSGTLAGCILGKALLGLDAWRVVGIPVSDSLKYFRPDVRQLMDAAITEFRLGLTAEQTPVELLGGYIGDGYAIPYPAAIETIRLVAQSTGLLLDPTYTGKAMHGMLDSLKNGNVLRPGATPVFLHTGGGFGLMARRELFPASSPGIQGDC